jgi:hypothetical protein
MPFGRNARIQLEHGGTNESTQHYETVAYWYGIPAPSLIRTDELIVGDEKSERAHSYHSPGASAPYELTSRYEWGPDTIAGEEIYPAQRDKGRKTKTASEFTLKIDPRNYGVLLRRKRGVAGPCALGTRRAVCAGRGSRHFCGPQHRLRYPTNL